MTDPREEFIQACRRHCSCDTGTCNVCHIQRKGEAAINHKRTSRFEDILNFYNDIAKILEMDLTEVEKKIHPALKHLID